MNKSKKSKQVFLRKRDIKWKNMNMNMNMNMNTHKALRSDLVDPTCWIYNVYRIKRYNNNNNNNNNKEIEVKNQRACLFW